MRLIDARDLAKSGNRNWLLLGTVQVLVTHLIVPTYGRH